jgi:hypothetical protein
VISSATNQKLLSSLLVHERLSHTYIFRGMDNFDPVHEVSTDISETSRLNLVFEFRLKMSAVFSFVSFCSSIFIIAQYN